LVNGLNEFLALLPGDEFSHQAGDVVLFRPGDLGQLARKKGEVSLRQFRMIDRFISLTRA